MAAGDDPLGRVWVILKRFNRSNVVHAFAGCNPPAAADPDQARRGVERWRAAMDREADPEFRKIADGLQADESAMRLLSAVFGNSPFLTLAAELDPVFLTDLLRDGPEAALRGIMAQVAAAKRDALEGGTPAATLRTAKRRVSLATALADIAGVWTLEQVTGALSDFAEAALDAALTFLLSDAAASGTITLQGDHPERRS